MLSVDVDGWQSAFLLQNEYLISLLLLDESPSGAKFRRVVWKRTSKLKI